ncbi:hypothetical protein [Rhizobium sp. RU36D]|uniref:hypothetical protein n=1 Tax=Rhizobium sp. RU36D TaxID=1907415 RepID=UPI0009D90158|nr:hypothetical protein [Rhizobium sp. RU36D]SMD18246.1 hypothetical protein SAMN05880593_13449 [Rhizobium sp. RU36D]
MNPCHRTPPNNAKLPDDLGLARLAAAGFSRREIAEHYGVRQQSVRDRFSAIGIKVALDIHRARPSDTRKVIKAGPTGPISLPALSFLEKSNG